MTDQLSDIAANFAQVRRRIEKAAVAAGRNPADVVLTAVTKQQPPAAIDAALAAGQRVFGENRVQEAQDRWRDRRTATPDLELRLIGPLQSNKTADALALFDVIETVDRYYREHNANVHRGIHTLSEEATNIYEGARASVAAHIGAAPREVIFTR